MDSSQELTVNRNFYMSSQILTFFEKWFRPVVVKHRSTDCTDYTDWRHWGGNPQTGSFFFWKFLVCVLFFGKTQIPIWFLKNTECMYLYKCVKVVALEGFFENWCLCQTYRQSRSQSTIIAKTWIGGSKLEPQNQPMLGLTQGWKCKA